MVVFFFNLEDLRGSLHSERCFCFNFFQAFFMGEVMNTILVWPDAGNKSCSCSMFVRLWGAIWGAANLPILPKELVVQLTTTAQANFELKSQILRARVSSEWCDKHVHPPVMGAKVWYCSSCKYTTSHAGYLVHIFQLGLLCSNQVWFSPENIWQHVKGLSFMHIHVMPIRGRMWPSCHIQIVLSVVVCLWPIFWGQCPMPGGSNSSEA